MIEIARERTIPVPAGRVWEVVSEAKRLPEWYARAASAEVLEGSGLGRRQRLHSQWQGQDSEVDQLITAFEPERHEEGALEAEELPPVGGQPRFGFSSKERLDGVAGQSEQIPARLARKFFFGQALGSPSGSRSRNARIVASRSSRCPAKK